MRGLNEPSFRKEIVWAFPVFWIAMKLNVYRPFHDDIVGGARSAVLVLDDNSWFPLSTRSCGRKQAKNLLDHGCGVCQFVDKLRISFRQGRSFRTVLA